MNPTFISWCPFANTLCVGSFEPNSNEGSIGFCDETGHVKESGIVRKARATCCEWHPSETKVAVGWEDGTMLISNHSNGEIIDKSSRVDGLRWSRDGSVLLIISSDSIRLMSGGKKSYEASLEGTVTCSALSTSIMMSDRRMNSEFLCATTNGSIYIVGRQKHELFYKIDANILFVGYCSDMSLVVVVTEELFVYHLAQNDKNEVKEKVKVKMSGSGKVCVALLENSFVLSAGENEFRVWDLKKQENQVVKMEKFPNETVLMVTMNLRRGIITCVTNESKVIHWKKTKADWKIKASTTLSGKIIDIGWSFDSNHLAVITDSELIMLEDEKFIADMRGKIAAIQTASNCFQLLNAANGVSQELRVNQANACTGISLAEKQLAVWNDAQILTYDVQSSLATIQSTLFDCSALLVIMANQTLYCIEKDVINARTLQGTIRQTITLPEFEGEPRLMHLNRNFLVVGSNRAFVRVYNIGNKTATHEFHSKRIVEEGPFERFLAVKINSAGNKIACTFYETKTQASERVYIYDAENDNLTYFSFNNGMTDTQEYEVQAELAHTSTHRPVTAAARKMVRDKNRFEMKNHRPGNVEWDEFDSRLLVVECNHVDPDSADNRVLTMFVTSEHGIVLHDIQVKSGQCGKLLAVSIPHFYFLRKADCEEHEEDVRSEKVIGKSLVAKTLREFVGVDNCDEGTKKAMLDFSFQLTLGRMDEAFKAIQFIKSESVWEQMASMSVKTRRLDVAIVCLGHMRNVRGAHAVRHAMREDQGMQCAALAVELGMIDEAQSIFASHARWDLVNRLYQSQSLWEHAFQVAESKDRIHLRNTHYNYAKFLEQSGNFELAIEHFEKAGVNQFEVFRMLKNNPKAMENYVRKKREPELLKWWGMFLESQHDLDGALTFYTFADDYSSIARINCAMDKLDEAAKVAQSSKDKAACYIVGRAFEAAGDVQMAVKFYTKARAMSSAIRLAKEHDMKDKLANLCLMAGGYQLVNAARYYEEMNGYAHKAVMLYHKAGMIGRALDLAFRTEQFSALDLIKKDLNEKTDPKVLKRAAEFFENNNNYENAIDLLCMAADYENAIKLCKTKNVPITDKLAEQLTPTKAAINDERKRKEILTDVAELCLQQGSYSAAAKKFTQAGDKLTAMRALLKSGDVQKIRFFANTARNKDIYILAANFLQTTDWYSDPTIVKDIELFYTKSQSFIHLANFYKSCAQMESEDWSQFSKCQASLHMAAACLKKAEEKSESGENVRMLAEHISKFESQLNKMMDILETMQTDNTDGIRKLTSLAEQSDEEDLIPSSKIFSMIIVEYASKKNWKQAYRMITNLQKKIPNIELENYISSEILDEICDEMKVERITKRRVEHESDDEQEIDFSHSLRRNM